VNNVLFVSNLGDNVTEEQLRELFAQYGEISSVKFNSDEASGRRHALMQMAVEKTATKANHALNGYLLDGRYLAISYADYDPSKPMLSKQRKAAEEIATELGESEDVPLRQLQAMLHLCGSSFAHAILKEAREVAAGEGIITSDGSRKRTLGGIFFYLARFRMSPAVRRIVYTRKGKFPKPEDETSEAAEEV
jgi:hypothetical protein